MKSLYFFIPALFLAGSLNAQKFYIDPVNGNPGGNGSVNNPWRIIEEVIEANLIESFQPVHYPYDGTTELELKNPGAPVGGGDTLVLRNGYHGEIVLLRYYNQNAVTIIAEEGHTPIISRLKLTAGKNWIFSGLTVSPEFADTYVRNDLFRLESHNWSGPVTDVIIENCKGYSVSNASGWSAGDWDTLACSGISCSASNVHLINNELTNVNFGITVSGNNCIIRNNSIINFSGDGLRGLGNDLLFEYNIVKNCYDVNENHDDGFQSWVVEGESPPERVTLRGNTIINYEDPEQPLRGTLQGIGLFDGPYIAWVIENNVIIVDHWHGISIYGGINCRVVNNTVVDLNDADPGPPWIRVEDLKDGSHSENCFVRNNLAKSYIIGEGVTSDHNITIDDYDNFFIDYENKELRLKPGCIAIDAGTPDLAPGIDIAGTTRPMGQGYDIGAYEFLPAAGISENKFLPGEFSLSQNYPNPFNPATTIEYFLPKQSFLSVKLFDLLGNEISTLVNEEKTAGSHSIKFNADNFPSGVYFYELKTNEIIITKKMMLLR